MEFIFEYGLFLAKSLTIVVAIVFTVAAILALALKEKSDEDTLLITNLKDKYLDLTENLQAETLEKSQFKKWLKSQKKKLKAQDKQNKEADHQPRLFVVNFDGDIKASQVDHLREIISAIISIGHKKDEVLLVLDSAGGYVHSYGLAASQLHRLRNHHLHLTVAIDKCAASGGYLMACVANHIIAAPFAIVGSIGVMAQVPNFHRLLEKHDIDFELHTAGEYKRTLTMFGKNTDKGRKKFQEEIEETHDLFKNFIRFHRPQVDVDQVATGEHWHAQDTIKTKLVDKIQTSDDYILAKIKEMDVFELSFEEKESFSDKLMDNFLSKLELKIARVFKRFTSKKDIQL